MRHVIAALPLACLLGCAGEPPPATEQTSWPITNGSLATAGGQPYAVFLSMGKANGSTYICSGTLIDDDVVLTAAHCLVCSTAVVAWVLGEAAPGQPAGTKPIIPHVASSFEFRPEAYPVMPNCSLQGEAYEDDVNDKTVNTADVGIVHLSVPSFAAPMPVLTNPPRGFNPAQDLAGQLVTIVGRGHPSNTNADQDHMRVGTSDLDLWTNGASDGGTCKASSLDRDPFALKSLNDTYDDPPVVESAILGGDSGGPMLATVNGQERVIGVASGGISDIISLHASVFTAGNAAFIRTHLGQSDFLFDSDGDDVAEANDNCPGQFNPDQTDRDGDGVGDLCDNCTPLAANGVPALYAHDGTPTSAYAAYYNPDQANCNLEAELDRIFTEHPEYGDSLPAVTQDDFLFAFGDEPECDDRLVGARHRYLRGDACDPIPCAEVETVTTDVTDLVIPASPGGICRVNGYAIGFCSYEMPSGFEIEPNAQPSDDGTTGEVGLRFCECDGDRETPLERRQNCGSATTFNCAIDGSMFSSGGNSWRPVSIADPPLVDAVFGPNRPEVGVAWDFLADLTAWTGIPVPPPPWDIEDARIQGGPAIDGILWSHVAVYDGYEIDEHPGNFFSPRKYREIANWYGAADTSIHTVVHWREIPRYKPAWPWTYCARCIRELPWTWILDIERRAVVGVGPEWAEDVSDLFDPVAIQLMGGTGLRIPAAEAEYQLVGTARRELVVDAGRVVGALHVDHEAVEGEVIVEQRARTVGARLEARLAAPPAGSLLVYSAARDELYAVAGNRGEVPLSLWTRARGWQAVALRGDRLLEPVAATFRLDEGALYVLDRAKLGAPIRLVRVDLDTGIIAVRDGRLIEGSPSATSLSVGLDGQLLVASASNGTTRLARLDVGGRTVLLRALASHSGAMTGDARETAAGVAFLVPRERTFDPRLVSAGAFEPVRDGARRPIFPR
jgi:hypothetical protein